MRVAIAMLCLLLAGCGGPDIHRVTVVGQLMVTSEPHGQGERQMIVVVETDDGRNFYEMSDLPIGYQFEKDISGSVELENYVPMVYSPEVKLIRIEEGES